MNELLTADHGELDVLLDRFFKALDAGDALEIYEKLDIFWARLAMHIRAEHLHLFPFITKANEIKGAMEAETVKNTITKLHSDHDFFVRELAAAVKLMREQIRYGEVSSKKMSEVRDKVMAVRELLKVHNEIEESLVYIWAEDLVDESEHGELNELIQRELDRLPPRFDGDRDGARPRKYE